MDFVTSVYKVTGSFPAHEMYGLTNQVRRAATSIALNIAEGASSGYGTEYQRFLKLAIRSANEVATGLEIAGRLGYCQNEAVQRHIGEADEIAAMLQGLHRSLGQVSEPAEVYVSDELRADTGTEETSMLLISNDER